ncbi:MAG: flagellar filament capping protein FliD [Clostridiales Family XIII bacterium]|nr:flagellar filament capping protein FliD [Clostridiales Family XIII bacterium]
MAYSVGSVTGLLTKTGIGGLASGMDIDGLIEKMTSAQRQRITQQEQTVQKLLWRQDAYRTVTKSLMEFREKYLSVTSATNFKSTSVFNTVKASVADGMTAFTATATSNAIAGKVYVNQIQQLASSYKVASNSSVSAPLTGTGVAVRNSLRELAIPYTQGEAQGFMLTVDGQSRAVVIDDAFLDSLGTVGGVPGGTLLADVDLKSGAPEVPDAYDALEKGLQRKINQLFENPANLDSSGDIIGTGKALVEVSLDNTTGKINFSSNRASKITMGYLTEPKPIALDESAYPTHQDYVNAVDAEKRLCMEFNVLTQLGFTNGQTNRLDVNKSIDELANALGGAMTKPGTGDPYQFFINGVLFQINQGESVNSLMSKINSSKAGVTMSYSDVTDTFTMTSNTTGAGVGIQIDEFGHSNLFEALGLNINTANPALKPNETFGTNAIAFINGNYVERSSNSFTIEGVQITLKELYNEQANFNPFDPSFVPPVANSGHAITLATSPDDLFNAIKSFVEDYNAMVTAMRGLTKEKVNSDYEPLTDAQRAEMTEGQVKLWEEKAKSGILANDNLINSIASKLQSALLATNVDRFGMYSMGIDSAGWNENGKLKLDETKLRDALNNHADEVRTLFLDATNGIAGKLDKIIDDSVRTNGVKGTRGSLIEMAGYEATRSDLDNGIQLQIDNYNKRIDMYKDMLKREESRLWSQFSAMETALSRLNEQSSLLAQYLGGASS